jgi:hypothetical protein
LAALLALLTEAVVAADRTTLSMEAQAALVLS